MNKIIRLLNKGGFKLVAMAISITVIVVIVKVVMVVLPKVMKVLGVM